VLAGFLLEQLCSERSTRCRYGSIEFGTGRRYCDIFEFLGHVFGHALISDDLAFGDSEV
jgi:hypothetical protein